VESALRAAGFDKVSVKPTTAEPAKTFDVVGTNSVVKQPEANDVRRAIVQALGRKKSLTGANLALSDPWPKSDYVGPKVVKDLKANAVLALVLSLAAIMVYVKFRFKEFKYGLGTVLSLLHDITVPLGIITFFDAAHIVDAKMNLSMLAAFLTIVGYSVN